MISEVLIQAKISQRRTVDKDQSTRDHEESANHSSQFSSSAILRPIHLDLSFQSIERIGNLPGFGNIVSLVLNNNRIKRIIGLEKLIHLKRLDLSFNEIKIIEGLSTLVELEELSFYHNQIEKISGLEKCFSLKSLSLGLNNISQIDNILTIRNLKQLKDLVLNGNPIAEQNKNNYRSHVISNLKQLKYLDNLKVPREEITENDANDTKIDTEKVVVSDIFSYLHLNDHVHPLERIIMLFAKEQLGTDEGHYKSGLNQCRSIINCYIQKTQELKDNYSNQIKSVLNRIKYRSHETIEDIVCKQKSKMIQDELFIKHQKRMSHQKQTTYDEMMEMEMALFNKNKDTIINELKGKCLEKFFESKQDEKEKVLELLMDAIKSMKSESLPIMRHAEESVTTCEDSPNSSSFHVLENKIQSEIERLEEEDKTSAKTQFHTLLLDLEARHNLRVCQIIKLISQDTLNEQNQRNR